MSISHIAHKALRGARPLCCLVWGAVLCWEVEAEVSLSMCMLLKLLMLLMLLKLLHGGPARSSGAPVSHLLLSQSVSVFTAASLERRRYLSGGGAEVKYPRGLNCGWACGVSGACSRRAGRLHSAAITRPLPGSLMFQLGIHRTPRSRSGY